jgi:hypothetical protein
MKQRSDIRETLGSVCRCCPIRATVQVANENVRNLMPVGWSEVDSLLRASYFESDPKHRSLREPFGSLVQRPLAQLGTKIAHSPSQALTQERA